MSTDTTKALRIDLLIAICALVVSSLAAAAAVYQGRLIARQLSVTVWPYIVFRESSNNTSMEVDVENVGSGPAIVGDAAFMVDGQVQGSLSAALTDLNFRKMTGATVTLTNLGPGSVIRPGDAVTLVRVVSKPFAQQAAQIQKRVSIDVCYCSMLDQCWLRTTRVTRPTEVKGCEGGREIKT